MLPPDVLKFTISSVIAHRMRSALTALGISVGVSAVVILTSMGEGLHQHIGKQFSQFGTNIMGVNPGNPSTIGFGSFASRVNSVRPLTIDDAVALMEAPHVTASAGYFFGSAELEANELQREVGVLGAGPLIAEIMNLGISVGKFLPDENPHSNRPVVVLGRTIKDDMFGSKNPLGKRIRIGGSRFRVIGVVRARGNLMGFDVDRTVFIPVGSALQLFNRDAIQEINVIYREGAPIEEVVEGIRRILIARHGSEDFHIITQQQMLDISGSIMGVVKFAVAALGSISLLVGGVGIFTIMTIAVKERIQEIGLLRAIGSSRAQIQRIFLSESIILAGIGGTLGLLAGWFLVALIGGSIMNLPVELSLPYVFAAEGVALLIGLIAGILPAQSAAKIDPLEALREE